MDGQASYNFGKGSLGERLRRRSDGAAVPVYLVERYLPGLSVETTRGWQARLTQVAAEIGGDRTAVRYLGATVVPGDECCLCQFQACSLKDVAALNEQAGVPFARIVPAIAIGSRIFAPKETPLRPEAS